MNNNTNDLTFVSQVVDGVAFQISGGGDNWILKISGKEAEGVVKLDFIKDLIERAREAWELALPHHQKVIELIARASEGSRAEALREVREIINGKMKIMWSDDVAQHIRNIQNNDTLNDLLRTLEDKQ